MTPIIEARRLTKHFGTADPADLAFHVRFGFDFERRVQLIPDGPRHYSMRRPPQSLPQKGLS